MASWARRHCTERAPPISPDGKSIHLMKYTTLGRSGLRVSRIGLGTSTFGTNAERAYAFGIDRALPIVRRALDLGINFFDSAEQYSAGTSEAVLGQCLKECHIRREEVVIATKVGVVPPKGDVNFALPLSRKHIMHAIDGSLERLQTDYIDLYQIHRLYPGPPFEETLGALNDCLKAGKVRYLGVSSMYAWQLERLLGLQERHGWSPFISVQNYYNLAYREEEREMMPLCLDRGLGVLPWGALSAGLLAGNVSRDGTKHSVRAGSDIFKGLYPPAAQDFDIQDRVRDVAARAGCSMAQIAMAWVLSKQAVSMSLVGATQVAQLEDTVGALSIGLDGDSQRQLEELYRPIWPQSI
jgi:1-deoxyxylulose-5-phosphate synthase